MAERISAADLKNAVAATVTLHLADGTTRQIPIGASGPYRLGIDLNTERKPIETFEDHNWRTFEPSPHLGVQVTLAGAWLTEPAEERATALDHADGIDDLTGTW